MALSPAWAALGQDERSILHERQHSSAHYSRVARASYSMHDLRSADGSRIRQFVGNQGKVFAVTWSALYKPDLSVLLGDGYSSYSEAAHAAARTSGIQHNFRHQANDLIVQSMGHLHVFTGYAYRPSMVPPGFDLAHMAQE